MGAKEGENMKRDLPARTLLLMLVAVVIFAVPTLSSLLIYDREAILAGEIWRLITGNLVHFTPAHLFFDLTAVGVAGWIIEQRGYPHFWGVAGLSAFSVGAGLLAGIPEASRYGGLSGVAIGMTAYASLCGMKENGLWQRVCTALFLLIMVKVALEFLTGQSLSTAIAKTPFIPVPLSHAMGAFAGVLVALSNNGLVISSRLLKNPGHV